MTMIQKEIFWVSELPSILSSLVSQDFSDIVERIKWDTALQKSKEKMVLLCQIYKKKQREKRQEKIEQGTEGLGFHRKIRYYLIIFNIFTMID